ncbi:MAG: hypothetical protein P8J42_02105 [Pseudomonadales bacterium]|nr:hypothetical protein [Pseudomonadales bacterium]MDG2035388.1 hypothetical protein [Pseudomonadales bacterium]
MNDAPLTVGMSEADVKAATAKGKTTDIIEYYNQVQNMKTSKAA